MVVSTIVEGQADTLAALGSADWDATGARPVPAWLPCTAEGSDPDDWFLLADDPDRPPSSEKMRHQLRIEAAVLCAGCPIAAQCLNVALARRERYGVWGGMSACDRSDMLRQRTTRRRAVA